MSRTKHGGFTLIRQQTTHEEKNGDQVQLTRFGPLTPQVDMAHSPSTVQNARRGRGDSTDSGVGTKSSHNSCSDLSQEGTDELASHDCGITGNSSTQAPLTQTNSLPAERQVMEENKDGCYLVQMKQSLSELRSSLEKLIKELSDRVENLEQNVQMVQSKVSSLSASSVLLDQPSCSSSCHDSPMKRETEPIPLTPDMPNLDSHFTMIKDQRCYTDSQITKHRRSEIQKRVGSTKLRSPTQIGDTIPEDEGIKAQEVHSSSQQENLRQQVTDRSGLTNREEELRSRVKRKLPEFIELTNWEYLVPHLVSVDLSDPATTDYLLNETRTEHKKGVYFYLKVLPSKGLDAYTRFYKCLCGERIHLGHKTLLRFCDI